MSFRVSSASVLQWQPLSRIDRFGRSSLNDERPQASAAGAHHPILIISKSHTWPAKSRGASKRSVSDADARISATEEFQYVQPNRRILPGRETPPVRPAGVHPCMEVFWHIGSVPPRNGTGPAVASARPVGWPSDRRLPPKPLGLSGSRIAAGRLHRTRMVAGTQGSHSQGRVEKDV